MKLPWNKWYAREYLSDVAVGRCRLATKGFWSEALNQMIANGTDRIEGRLEDFPSMIRRCTVEDAFLCVDDLAEQGAADVFVDGIQFAVWKSAASKNGNLSYANIIANDLAKVKLTVINRRRSRELEISKIRSTVGKKGQQTKQANAKQRSEKVLGQTSISPSPSSSVSSSPGESEGGGKMTPPLPADSEIPALAECREYATNPACGFPPGLVEEWFNKSADRGWGHDWRARMRGAVATYRAMETERKAKGGQSVAQPNGKRAAWQVEKDLEAARRMYESSTTDCPFGDDIENRERRKRWLQTPAGKESTRLSTRVRALRDELKGAI